MKLVNITKETQVSPKSTLTLTLGHCCTSSIAIHFNAVDDHAKEATSRLLGHVAALVSPETKEENQRRHNALSAGAMETEEEKPTKATTMETCINKIK